MNNKDCDGQAVQDGDDKTLGKSRPSCPIDDRGIKIECIEAERQESDKKTTSLKALL